ncbi:ABC transporter permease [Porphyromonas gingivalis]|uniref:ABC transporter permease n=1 Tax=Porphyromonas gingivalis TaxID=837 RepID=UPI00020F01F1|nr:ABC transporter permease [Porphyromonas gingivalis]ALO29416.1 ABC-type transport system, involved in lipoprotein release, permease component [Porphyromonas gingivalis A7A1-28]ATS00831.1 ABC transporter permease [Porphyromonas gingivalis]AUR47753.1 lipoprotein-releasing system [Porphyromonas gingivalis]SJL33511.1 ABC transporter permease [Porphyromonas gingivalis]BAK25379.1 putative ABC transporter permease protein [Porphyromonas gingivalis TDC60]
MKIDFFLAGRLFRGGGKEGKGIAPIVRLSVIGIMLSLMVMLITVSIAGGFKQNIRSLVYGYTGHLCIAPVAGTSDHFNAPVGMLEAITSVEGVDRVVPTIEMTGVAKTDSAFAGILLMGDNSLRTRNPLFGQTVSGNYPNFSSADTVPNPILLPQVTADKLHLKIGDKLRIYFAGTERMRLRAFTVVGVYSGGKMDMPVGLVSADVLRRVGGLGADDVSRLLIYASDPDETDLIVTRVFDRLSETLYVGEQRLTINTATELNPMIMDWLSALDTNVAILLTLMGLVGGFTMIAGLIVLVMDKTQFIGMLKALGCGEGSLRRIFLYLAMMLVGRGMIWGNVLALILCLLQQHFRWLRLLDPDIYYMDYVPVQVDWLVWILVNLGTLLVTFLMLLAPSHIISRISPVKALRFE